jgi:predicted esterase
VGAVVAVAAIVLVARHVAGRRGYSSSFGNRIVHFELSSRVLGRRVAEIAVVPPHSGGGHLLFLLHGRHDPGPLSWLLPEKSGPESMLDDALLRALAGLGRRAPVVVLLNGGAHSYFHDRRDGSWGTMLIDEAIPDAAGRFDARRVAIGGISMGGYGALYLASRRPRQFCAVGGHSAALSTTPGASAPGAFDDAEDWQAHDVFAAARAGAYDHVPVRIDGGTNDPFHDADAAFVSVLRSRGDAVTYHVWPGGHTGSYWHAHMAAYLRFYADALARCR